jgi:hypothetical protein
LKEYFFPPPGVFNSGSKENSIPVTLTNLNLEKPELLSGFTNQLIKPLVKTSGGGKWPNVAEKKTFPP